jgi:uncharacterized protein (TIGR03437 family)
VVVTASVEGIISTRFELTATSPAPPPPPVNVNKPAIRSGGVTRAAAFGPSGTIAPGSWIEIYGSNFAPAAREWTGADFVNGTAPTQMDGVRVLIGGRRAYLRYIAPAQINAQVPDGIGVGPVNVVVETAEGASDPAPVVAAERAPGMLAPGAFQVGGVQYAVAQFADGVYVGRPNLIAGAAFRPAKAGDTIVMYGIGFGAVTPAIASGQITGAANALPNVVVRLGGVAAQTAYAGLAGSFVGLYQFNIVIPAGLAGDVPLTMEVNGVPLTQQLMLTAGN